MTARRPAANWGSPQSRDSHMSILSHVTTDPPSPRHTCFLAANSARGATDVNSSSFAYSQCEINLETLNSFHETIKRIAMSWGYHDDIKSGLTTTEPGTRGCSRSLSFRHNVSPRYCTCKLAKLPHTSALSSSDNRRQHETNTTNKTMSLTIMHYLSFQYLLQRAIPPIPKPKPKTNTGVVVTRTDQPCSYMLLS